MKAGMDKSHHLSTFASVNKEKMPPTISGVKRMRVNNEPVFVHEDGKTEEYIPKKLKTARDAYSVSLHMIFKHIADFHLCVVEIISEKTGLTQDEILNTILDDPRYKNMFVHPVLSTFGYVHTPDVAKVVPEAEEVKADAEPPAQDKIVEAMEPAPTKKSTKKVVVKKLEATSEKPTKKTTKKIEKDEDEWVRDAELCYEEHVATAEAVKAEQEKKIAEAVKLAEATAAMAATSLEEPAKKKSIVRRKPKTST
jgi:hypothetical protein